jgi:hypothetical protein
MNDDQKLGTFMLGALAFLVLTVLYFTKGISGLLTVIGIAVIASSFLFLFIKRIQ